MGGPRGGMMTMGGPRGGPMGGPRGGMTMGGPRGGPRGVSRGSPMLSAQEAGPLLVKHFSSQDGFLFECDAGSFREVVARGLFGGPEELRKDMEGIVEGTPLLLRNLSNKQLLGLFVAEAAPGMFVRGALASPLLPQGAPVQVRARALIECPPAPEAAYSRVFPKEPEAGFVPKALLRAVAELMLGATPSGAIAGAGTALQKRLSKDVREEVSTKEGKREEAEKGEREEAEKGEREDVIMGGSSSDRRRRA
jgi:hypothetical protein